MMNLSRQLAIVLPLSLAAGWAGMLLARPHQVVSASSTADAPARVASHRPTETGTPAGRGKNDGGFRELIASSSSAVLWQWLESHIADEKQAVARYKILRELYAREGLGAWTTLLTNPEPGASESLSNEFLGMLSTQDPWLSYDLFLRNKDSFGKEWGLAASPAILSAACSISAEKFIEVMERSGYDDTNCWFNTELPADFDFKKLITHLETSEHMPGGLPSDLIPAWAEQSPKEAAEWLLSQPKPDDQSRMRYLLEEEMVYHNTLLSLAESVQPGRDDGLAAFSKLPAGILEKSWTWLAEKLDGKVNASVLDAATHMDARDDYLVLSLLEARGHAAPDASWSTVPEQDRLRTLDLAERRWKEEDPSPVQEKARQEWKARLQKAWNGGN